MRVHIYEHQKDEGKLRALLNLRRQPIAFLQEVPALGLSILDEHEMPICFGFLRMIEGGSAFIDGVITHPGFDSNVRHHALILLIDRLIEMATKQGLRRLVAYSVEDSIMKRSKMHNFKEVPHKIVGLDLEKGN